MDRFVTTYRRDYLWPYVRVMGERPSHENYYPPLSTMGHGDQGQMCACHCVQRAIPKNVDKVFGPAALKEEVWSKVGAVAPLIDPKIYPAQVGRCPEVDTMRFNQPNVFLKKLQDKYPYVYEILRQAPPDDMISRINRDRLRTTYQVDYCKMSEYPNAPYDELLRAAGVDGMAPCEEPVRLPGDPCRPNQRAIAFRPATISKEGKPKGSFFGGPARGAECGMTSGGSGKYGGIGTGAGAKERKGSSKCSGGLSGLTPGMTEYQDAISKLGELIMKDKIHYRGLKKF